MLCAEGTLICPDCSPRLALTPEAGHTRPCLQKGPRRCASCGHAHGADRCGMAAGLMSWVVSEDKGLIQHVGDDGTEEIVRVFTQSGTLLAEAGAAPLVSRAVLSKPGERGGKDRLLAYYIGRGGRRVILQDRHGSSWLGRIAGTRWHAKGRVWFFRNCPVTAAA